MFKKYTVIFKYTFATVDKDNLLQFTTFEFHTQHNFACRINPRLLVPSDQRMILRLFFFWSFENPAPRGETIIDTIHDVLLFPLFFVFAFFTNAANPTWCQRRRFPKERNGSRSIDEHSSSDNGVDKANHPTAFYQRPT